MKGFHIRVWVASMVLSPVVCPAWGQTTHWGNSGFGDWFNSSNWSAGAPTSEISAQINNGGEAAAITVGG